MAIENNEQGGIAYEHSKSKVDAEKLAAKDEAKNVTRDVKVNKAAPPAQSADIINRGGIPHKHENKHGNEAIPRIEDAKREHKEHKIRMRQKEQEHEKQKQEQKKQEQEKEQHALEVENQQKANAFTDPLFKLMTKTINEEEGWEKYTTAMDTGRGCLVQVTTKQKNPDGSYAIAEALTFVPGANLKEQVNSKGVCIGRTFVGAR